MSKKTHIVTNLSAGALTFIEPGPNFVTVPPGKAVSLDLSDYKETKREFIAGLVASSVIELQHIGGVAEAPVDLSAAGAAITAAGLDELRGELASAQEALKQRDGLVESLRAQAEADYAKVQGLQDLLEKALAEKEADQAEKERLTKTVSDLQAQLQPAQGSADAGKAAAKTPAKDKAAAQQ